MASILRHSESSEALAGLVALSTVSSSSSNALSPSVEKGTHIEFDYPNFQHFSSGTSPRNVVASKTNHSSAAATTSTSTSTSTAVPANKTLFSLKAARPRAYTEGDAYEIFESFRRPRANTLSDEDAVGALLSFSYSGSPKSKEEEERRRSSESGSTTSWVPRARAMSDMSHAMLRLGKLEMDGSGGSGGGGGSGSGSGGGGGGSGGSGGQFPMYSRGMKILEFIHLVQEKKDYVVF